MFFTRKSPYQQRLERDSKTMNLDDLRKEILGARKKIGEYENKLSKSRSVQEEEYYFHELDGLSSNLEYLLDLESYMTKQNNSKRRKKR